MPLFRTIVKKYEDTEEYDDLLQQLLWLTGGAKSTEIFLARNPRIATEYPVSRLWQKISKAAIEGNEDELHFMAEQYTIFRSLLSHARSLRCDPMNEKVREQFFGEFHNANPLFLEQFHEEVRLLENELRSEAQTKREEAMAVREKRLDPQDSGVVGTYAEKLDPCP